MHTFATLSLAALVAAGLFASDARACSMTPAGAAAKEIDAVNRAAFNRLQASRAEHLFVTSVASRGVYGGEFVVVVRGNAQECFVWNARAETEPTCRVRVRFDGPAMRCR